MKLSKMASVMTGVATLTLFSVGSARANIITGNLWRVPEATTYNAVPANVPVTPPDVVFDVNSPLNFSGNAVTIQTWLASGAAFNIVENTGGTLTSLMDNGITGTLLNFTGFVTVTTGQVFSVTHDDGLTLIIGALNLGFPPGPTAPVTTLKTYTGPSGTFPFQLVYAECCGGPAVLQVDLPLSNTAPEPAMFTLMAVGLAGLVRRSRRAR